MRKTTFLRKGRSPEQFVMEHFEAQRDGELNNKSLALFERNLATSPQARKWLHNQQELIYQLQLDATPSFSLAQEARRKIRGNIYKKLRQRTPLTRPGFIILAVFFLAMLGIGLSVGSDSSTTYIINYPSQPVAVELLPAGVPLQLGTSQISGELVQTRYGLVNGISVNQVSQIMIAADGALWLSTHNNTLFHFDGALWRSFSIEDADWQDYLQPIDHSDSSGIWLGGSQFGVTYFDGQRWQALPFAADGPAYGISSAARGPDGDIWLGTSSGLLRYDGFSWELFNIHDGLSYGSIHEIAIAADGAVWFTTYQVDGLARFDGAETTLVPFPEGSFGSHNLRLAPDGSTWLATENGPIRYGPEGWQQLRIQDGLVNNEIHLMEFTADGQLWVTTADALWRYDGQDWELVMSNAEAGAINAILPTASGEVWLLQDNGLVLLQPPSASPEPLPESLEEGS